VAALYIIKCVLLSAGRVHPSLWLHVAWGCEESEGNVAAGRPSFLGCSLHGRETQHGFGAARSLVSDGWVMMTESTSLFQLVWAVYVKFLGCM
jgi:hypothetical protein